MLAKGLYARPELQLRIEGSADPVTDLEALRREKAHRQIPLQERNAPKNLFPAAANAAAETASAQNLHKTVSLEKGAATLRSPVAHWSPITIQSKPSETNLFSHPARMFADDKGATALMRVFAPEVATGDPDSERKFLDSVPIPPDALSTLASERARNVRAYLLKAGKVEPQRITESAQGTASEGSRVYVWLE